MASRSKQLALADVIPGMVLSDDLLDSQGKVLLPQGVTLSEATLAALVRHNIDMLPILCEELSAADQAAEQEQHRRRLARLFRKHVDDEATGLMLEYLTHYRLGAPS